MLYQLLFCGRYLQIIKQLKQLLTREAREFPLQWIVHGWSERAPQLTIAYLPLLLYYSIQQGKVENYSHFSHCNCFFFSSTCVHCSRRSRFNLDDKFELARRNLMCITNYEWSAWPGERENFKSSPHRIRVNTSKHTQNMYGFIYGCQTDIHT